EFGAGMGPLVGYGDGQPFPTGPAYMDPVGGYNAAAAVMIALAHRQQSGRGQAAAISQVEAGMPLIGEIILAGIESGTDLPADGNHRPDAAPHKAYVTTGEDGWIAIAAFDDTQFAALCRVLGLEALGADARFADLAGRKANEAALDAAIAAA